MTVAVVLAALAPLGAWVLLRTRAGRCLADAWSPRAVAPSLVVLSVVLAVVGVTALVLVALLPVVGWDPVAVRPLWSLTAWLPGQPRETVDVVRVLATVAVVVLLVAAARVVRCVLGVLAQYREARAAVPPHAAAGSVIEVEGAVVAARAVPARRGHVLVDAVGWRGLAPAHRAVVLAHERAHLRHRHDLFLVAALVTQAAVPLLAPLTRALGYALERWADEDAAQAHGRGAVARAIGTVALSRAPRPGPALGVAGGDVPRRVEVLLRRDATSPAPREPRAAAVALALVLVALAAVGLGGHALADFLEITSTVR